MTTKVARSPRVWRIAGIVIALGLVVALAAGAVVHVCLETPTVSGAQPLDLSIAPGTPFGRVARTLAASGGYPYPRFLSAYARWRGLAGQVQAGDYRLAPGTSVDELLRKLTAGEVVLHRLTVIEGWTFAEFLAALHTHSAIEVTLAGLDAATIMARLGHAAEHPEGRFFPDTYSFARGTTDLVVLKRALEAMSTQLAAAWARRTPACVLKEPYEALILASIIEKETGREDERREIAGVFSRRLRLGMRLQTDPTVIYGIGPDFNGNLTRRDLRADTPYNTYTRSGLPPTPIALPGAASLAAAVDPKPGESLYFVATGDDDGSHYFSATLEEHQRAVQRYLKKLRARK